MSYDLMLRTVADEVLVAAQRLAGRFGCESCRGEDSSNLTVALSGASDDDALAKLYKGLVKLAKDHGFELFDPQRGAVVDLQTPGRYPALWVPSGPVAGKSFDAKVKAFLDDYARPLGFVSETKWTSRRRMEGLEHGINFHPGRNRLSGHFNINFFWTFILDGPSEAMDATFTLVEVLAAQGKVDTNGPSRGWLPTRPIASLEDSFEHARAVFFEQVLPRFDAVPSVERLVAEYDAGRLDLYEAFGRYSFTKKMAQCYRVLDRLDDGFARAEAFFENWREEIAVYMPPPSVPGSLAQIPTRQELLEFLEGEWGRTTEAFGRG